MYGVYMNSSLRLSFDVWCFHGVQGNCVYFVNDDDLKFVSSYSLLDDRQEYILTININTIILLIPSYCKSPPDFLLVGKFSLNVDGQYILLPSCLLLLAQHIAFSFWRGIRINLQRVEGEVCQEEGGRGRVKYKVSYDRFLDYWVRF